MTSRSYSPADRLLIGLQKKLSSVRAPAPAAATAASPAQTVNEGELDDRQRRHAAGLMRVNHAGEVAAQALYRGQALASRDPDVRRHLLAAADEERDHLAWCEQRLTELQDHPSRLAPLWYAGSFAMGAAAGLAGDRWSLGFVEETEKQVAEHLGDHLRQLPDADARSRAVVTAMRGDEMRHGQEAQALGGRELPVPVRSLMRRVAGLMKKAAYRW